MVVMWVVLAAAALPTGGFALGAAAGLPALHNHRHGASSFRVRTSPRRDGGPTALVATAGLAAVGLALAVLGMVIWPPPPGLTHLTVGTAAARAALVGLGALIGWVTTCP